jgi:hypothetical protein
MKIEHVCTTNIGIVCTINTPRSLIISDLVICRSKDIGTLWSDNRGTL